MSYWMTQSLLGSWIYCINAEDDYAESAFDSFISTLRREDKEPTKAMQDGIMFEDMINRMVAGEPLAGDYNEKWLGAAGYFARKCAGGQPQVPVTGRLTVDGIDFVLYGICDYVKAGIIMDIKKVTRYSYGKYQHSPQHPMYLRLLPEAKRFDYLIFDGTNTHIEPYRRGDFQPIEQTISEFIRFLKDDDLFDIYKKFWAMNAERERKQMDAI